MIITYGYFDIRGWDKTILLRLKRQFQIYISLVENIKDNYETLPESGLKRLNKCGFTHSRTIAGDGRKH